MELHGPRLQLPVAEQVRLVLAQVCVIELIRRAVEVCRKPFDGLEVVLNGGFRVVTSLELVEHRLAEMSHRNLLVTTPYPPYSAGASAPHA